MAAVINIGSLHSTQAALILPDGTIPRCTHTDAIISYAGTRNNLFLLTAIALCEKAVNGNFNISRQKS